MPEPSRIVVVGGGFAAGSAVRTLRGEGFDGPVTVVTRESLPPYERPSLSKEYLQGQDDALVITEPADWYAAHDVDLMLDTEVTAIEPDAHTVSAAGQTIPYASLILATGATADRLDVPGADGSNVLTLRTVADADVIRARAQEATRVAVVGAGWIGCEVTASLRRLGVDVALLDSASQPLSKLSGGSPVGDRLAALHASQGVELHMDSDIAAITGDGVELADGSSVIAPLVVLGTGVTPALGLAEDAGLTLAGGGVAVSPLLRTSQHDILAAGDIAAIEHPLYGTRVRVEHWDVAGSQGAHAARVALGADEEYDKPPFFFSDQYDLGFEYRGWVDPSGESQVVVRGDEDPMSPWFAFWLVDGSVRAAMNVNAYDDADALERLVRKQPRIDVERLVDADVPIAELA